MKYFSLVLMFILLLSFASCADRQTGSEIDEQADESALSEPDEGDGVDPETDDESGPMPGNPDRNYDIRLTNKFKALCREAVEIADRHLDGTLTPKETQEKLFEIIEKMVEEYNNLPEGDSSTAGSGAIMIAMTLHDNAYMDSPGDIETFRMRRGILEGFAKYRLVL